MISRPIFDMLTDASKDSYLSAINKYAAYREVLREILNSKDPVNANVLLEIAYNEQSVGILLPQPMEEITQKPDTVYDWILRNDDDEEVGNLLGSISWYPIVERSKSQDNYIEIELNRGDSTANVTVAGVHYTCKCVKTNTDEDYDYFAVLWPPVAGINATLKIKSDEDYAVLLLPRAKYDVDLVADNVMASEQVLNFLDDMDMLESMYLTDTAREKLAITVLAMYNSLAR